MIDLFPRYNIYDSLIISILLPTVTLLISIGALWQLIRSVHITTIKTRLLIAFIFVASVPLLISALVASVIGSRSTVDASVDLLTAVSTLKEQALISWAQGLRDIIHSENSRDYEQQPIAKLFNAVPDSPDYRVNYRSLDYRFGSTIKMRKEFEEILLLSKDW